MRFLCLEIHIRTSITDTGGNSERRLIDSKIARNERQHVKGLEGGRKFQCFVAFSECAGVREGARAGGGAHQVRPRRVPWSLNNQLNNIEIVSTN
jgi:hypothetical protein